MDLFFQGVEVADEEAAAVEGDEVVAAQFVECSGNGLAGGSGEVGDFLMGEKFFDEDFITDALSLFMGKFAEEFYDSAAAVFEDEGFEALFHFQHAGAHDAEQECLELAVFAVHVVQVAFVHDADGGIFEGLGKIVSFGLAEGDHFAKDLPRAKYGFGQLLAVFSFGSYLDAAFEDEVDFIGIAIRQIDVFSLVELFFDMQMAFVHFFGTKNAGYVNVLEKPESLFFHDETGLC